MNLSERLAINLNQATHRIRRLPVLVLSPHSRCNCRCVMCDIWRANANGVELSVEDLTPQVDSLKKLRVRLVVLSGGEALMHNNLWTLCRMLRTVADEIVLLSTGLLLKRHARDVVDHCDEVIVSLDGSPTVHDTIRNIPRAYSRLAEGVDAIYQLKPDFSVSARCVIQKENFRDLMNIVATAERLELKHISFLGADVSTEAFNRPGGWPEERVQSVALDSAETAEFEMLLTNNREALIAAHERGLVAESMPKLMAIASYYRALNGQGSFPAIRCNAPWVSAVVEANGDIRPCFFHPAYGNLSQGDIESSINSANAIAFRRGLDVATNPVCQRCVCSLNL